MAPFRWPEIRHDVCLAKEVATRMPVKKEDWQTIACILSEAFTEKGKPVELKERGCRERINRLLNKFEEDDKKSLKR
jgi:hypothetical protein